MVEAYAKQKFASHQYDYSNLLLEHRDSNGNMGLDKAEYERRFGESPDDIPLFRQLAERQWIENTDDRICLTSEGMGYSDYIGQLFITPEIRELMEIYSY